MLGAIIGDIVGSPYEFHNIKRKDFPLFQASSHFTDDTMMTLANAKWLAEDDTHSPAELVKLMRETGRSHPYIGYGPTFIKWLYAPDEYAKPYNSWGNGAGMRVSPVGMYAQSMEECLSLAKISAEVTHNHPEGIKGAQAIASSVFQVRESGNAFSEETKSRVKAFVEEHFGYYLDFTIDEIRPGYNFDVSCQGSCPQAIRAYLEGKDFEDAIRLAVSIGGDSDTIACMTGAIAGAAGQIPEEIARKAYDILTPDLQIILDKFEQAIGPSLHEH